MSLSCILCEAYTTNYKPFSLECRPLAILLYPRCFIKILWMFNSINFKAFYLFFQKQLKYNFLKYTRTSKVIRYFFNFLLTSMPIWLLWYDKLCITFIIWQLFPFNWYSMRSLLFCNWIRHTKQCTYKKVYMKQFYLNRIYLNQLYFK